jgi:predicted RNA-binding Zn ribbon-like protein
MKKIPMRDAEIHHLIGGALCLDFVNTLYGHTGQVLHEYLFDYTDLVLWSRHAQILTDSESSKLLRKSNQMPAEAQAVFQNAITLRETLFRVFSSLAQGLSPSFADIKTLNAIRAEVLHHSQLSQIGKDFLLGWDEPDSFERMLWPIVLSASELLTSESIHRLRECDSQSCDWLFLDSSRNHMRRWCSMDKCGNRAKMRRRYKRQREAISSISGHS